MSLTAQRQKNLVNQKQVQKFFTKKTKESETKEEEQVEDSDSDETLNEKQKENELGKVIDNLNMYDIMDDDVSSILITHKDGHHHPSSNYNNKKRVQAP